MAVAAPVAISVVTVPACTPVTVAVSAPCVSVTPSLVFASLPLPRSTPVMTLPVAVRVLSSVTASVSSLAVGVSSTMSIVTVTGEKYVGELLSSVTATVNALVSVPLTSAVRLVSSKR